MTGETTDEPTGKVAEGSEPETDAEPDDPDLDGDDYAEIDPEVAEQVADEAADEATDRPDETDDGGDSPGGDGTDEVPGAGAPSPDVTPGDVYCKALGLGAGAARSRFGSLDELDEETMDEYADLARYLDLDQLVDQWWEEHRGEQDIGPGKGILMFSGMFVVCVLADDPAIAESLPTDDLTESVEGVTA